MPDEHLEWRKTARVNRIATSEENIVLDKLLEYYSSWYSLQKGVAWLRRFVLFCCTKFKESTSGPEENIKGYLTVKEIQDATEKIVQLVQRKYYHEEIETLKPNESESYEPRKNNAKSLLKRNHPLPLGVVINVDKYNRRWRQAQELANAFWKRWLRDYLPLLQERQKWTAEKRNLQVNDLVLVVDERVTRGQWPMGLVEEIYPDKYGVVRQVLVRASNGKLRRDTRKLCSLKGAC
ncbi:Hypothetical predicted protein [Paramuricea clavata]|uniref:Uncharacterized protein n=1 Tax=Paramuricea clavata TaxID=317549 RepID=A0A7D9KZI7_PARCT|nr:Hypothetical predicted protein [Paramuricea clavata]